MIDSEGGPSFENLDLFLLWEEAREMDEGVKLLGEAMGKERLASLRQLEVTGCGVDEWENTTEDLSIGKTAFFTALSTVRLPQLIDLSVGFLPLTTADIALISLAVGMGNLSGLRKLALVSSLGVGKEEMEMLMNAVVESNEGLPRLHRLNVRGTRAGEGGAALGQALLSGKLGALHIIVLEECHLTNEAVKGLTRAVKQGVLASGSIIKFAENGGLGEDALQEWVEALKERNIISFRSLTSDV
uniref:Uncharacterized protein n=1 Tax=Chromera velia CCMP2878 TaxID=1169474 RepID=A0A0G4GMK3_9ALVE|eukprot:Cvel_4921.t1-p1 / transcript=Cvel_4921.t1 / gene=Cvel_4921 / organism=Chromera_velia_CCMP2878 / gene_product=hypothetical protein / transcript_product=hypothetical protein / location=Cvel_scaffold222:20279-21007(-) / protein_length=243 / sequence_SO=supercontig / SO=protein_coding / is_pseudo=false